jgi:hypothetical protein
MNVGNYKLLFHGIDTLQCAYFLQVVGRSGLDYHRLAEQKDSIRQSKRKHPLPGILGNTEFLLQPYGTSSGYSFGIENNDFKIEFSVFISPNFYVTFRSQALWHESAFILHDKFLAWAKSVGYEPTIREKLSRVDFCFDYDLPLVDFNLDSFASRSKKDSQHRENGKVQTFTLGKGDLVLRVYDKIAEIEQESGKVWFFLLWEQKGNVWRIEWQVRKAILRRFGIVTFDDLQGQRGDLLRYLAEEPDTLRQSNGDTNRSRWPLHPLWKNLQIMISTLNHLGVCRVYDDAALLEEVMMRMVISMYGYMKRVAAIRCIKTKQPLISPEHALSHFGNRMMKIHEPLDWEIDVKRRIKEYSLANGN